ncbi:MAG: F0F1 ATP synthase subunit epsilon [Defluviimonas sp.]|uniref:F0F1 ATP synthase subunit epsilon n=1 Tax=Albidovulum sp. TaxID=1872424 RepID=UPI002A34E6BA|nr:F0F1 ATP synthase subunit epsilon [Defluviimonas sp.]
MSGLHLTVTTPLEIVVDEAAVTMVRAGDASGEFGVLPGHADFLTVIDAGVLRWRGATSIWRYCALRGAIFSVSAGRDLRVACREAILGEDLASLEARVAEARVEARDAARRTHSRDIRLHAHAIRHLMRELAAGGDTLGLGMEGDP